jgi:hypothetical protein
MRRWVSYVAIAALVVAVGAACRAPWPHHGGPRERALHFHATGWFRTAYAADRWWLVTPDGKPFYSTGVNHVTASNDTDRASGRCPYCDAIAAGYPDVGAWADTTVQRLRDWGFNTIGSWSDLDRFGPRMPYTALLSMSGPADWFSPAFAANAAEVANTAVSPRKDDPNLIGWVTDSELRWGPDWRSQAQLLDEYLQLPVGAPGRAVAEQHAGDPMGFVRVLAERYFSVTSAAIRAVDPHHLLLGVKQVTQLTPPEVLEAARPYVDVFSVDDYELNAGLADLIHQTWPFYLPRDPDLSSIEEVVRKPLLVMEYSFRAADAGVPNSYPPIFPTYATQSERADAFAGYVQGLYRTPWIVGDHWFEYVDEPAGGRFDGEDSNFGLVSTSDTPWSTLVARMTQVHAQAPDRLARP